MEVSTVDYFSVYHDIGEPPKNIKFPEIGFLSSISPEKPESKNIFLLPKYSNL